MALYGYKPKHGKALWFKIKHGNAAPNKPRRRIRTHSKARAKREREYEKVKAVWLPQHPTCAACRLRHLTPRATDDVHHSRGRTGPLLTMSEFFIPVCRSCHDWIKDNSTEARRLGLICEKGKCNTK